MKAKRLYETCFYYLVWGRLVPLLFRPHPIYKGMPWEIMEINKFIWYFSAFNRELVENRIYLPSEIFKF